MTDKKQTNKQTKNLLKGNVSPCLLICSSTSGLQSVLRTMNGGEQIRSSNEKRRRRRWWELVELRLGEEILLKRSRKVEVELKITLENKSLIVSLVCTSREYKNYTWAAIFWQILISIKLNDWCKMSMLYLTLIYVSINEGQHILL